jgi:hypothetical protein
MKTCEAQKMEDIVPSCNKEKDNKASMTEEAIMKQIFHKVMRNTL